VTTVVSDAAAAVAAFATTNIDDFLVLTALFATAGGAGVRRRHITGGQYAGMGVLVGISGGLAVVFLALPDTWVGVLGLVPIALGIRGLARARGAATDQRQAAAAPVRGWLAVAGVTVANGADNVSLYTPLFRQASAGGVAVYVVVFALMVALWCTAALFLARRGPMIALMAVAGHWVVPAVFIAIGALIIARSGLILTFS